MSAALSLAIAACPHYGGGLRVKVESGRTPAKVYLVPKVRWLNDGAEGLLADDEYLKGSTGTPFYAADYAYMLAVRCADGSIHTQEIKPSLDVPINEYTLMCP